MSTSERISVLLIECNPFMPAHTPLSLGYLAAGLKKHGFRAEVLNIGSDTLFSTHGLARLLCEAKPRVVGLSAYQRNLFFVRGLAQFSKSLVPGCLTALGGPQATFLPAAALEELPSIDLVCRAEGEVALLRLAERLRDGAPWIGTPGWSGRNPDGSVWHGAPLEGSDDLDDYPSPYLDGTLRPQPSEEAILTGSRGCPSRCAFCYTPRAFGRRIRCHSVERIVEEMLCISRLGADRFWFADPSFTFQAERVHRFLDTLLARGPKGRIWLETRADLVDQEMLEKMKRAGVHTVAYGLESACPDVLKRIRKPLALEQVERALRLTQASGIEVELFSQYGLPGESLADAKKTLDFVLSNGIPVRGNTNAQQMQIYFGTDIQARPGAFGIRPLEERIPACLSVGSRYETDAMKAEEILKVADLWKAASVDGGKRTVS
ncbi:MAG: radical SAM protein [bacterium]